MENNTNSSFNNAQDDLSNFNLNIIDNTIRNLNIPKLIWSICTVFVFPVFIWYRDKKKNQQKQWDAIKQHIDQFSTTDRLDQKQIKDITGQIILPLFMNGSLREKITEQTSIDLRGINHKFVLHLSSLVRLVIMWARGILQYREEEGDRFLAEKTLFFIATKIDDDCKTDTLCSQLFSELCEVYGRIINSNDQSRDTEYAKSWFDKLHPKYWVYNLYPKYWCHRLLYDKFFSKQPHYYKFCSIPPHGAEFWFKKAIEKGKQYNSFAQITAQRDLLSQDTKEIAQKIKKLEIKYDQSSCSFKFKDVENKFSINDLVNDADALINSYNDLIKDNNSYTLSYLSETLMKTQIIPNKDREHIVKCDIKLLYLNVYKLVLKLLSNPLENIDNACLDNIFKLLESLRETFLINDPKDSTEEMDIDVVTHSEIQDVVYVLQKLGTVNIAHLTTEQKTELKCIQDQLNNNYAGCSGRHMFMSVDNAKLHCMHAIVNPHNNKLLIENYRKMYPESLSLFASSIAPVTDAFTATVSAESLNTVVIETPLGGENSACT